MTNLHGKFHVPSFLRFEIRRVINTRLLCFSRFLLRKSLNYFKSGISRKKTQHYSRLVNLKAVIYFTCYVNILGTCYDCGKCSLDGGTYYINFHEIRFSNAMRFVGCISSLLKYIHFESTAPVFYYNFILERFDIILHFVTKKK